MDFAFDMEPRPNKRRRLEGVAHDGEDHADGHSIRKGGRGTTGRAVPSAAETDDVEGHTEDLAEDYFLEDLSEDHAEHHEDIDDHTEDHAGQHFLEDNTEDPAEFHEDSEDHTKDSAGQDSLEDHTEDHAEFQEDPEAHTDTDEDRAEHRATNTRSTDEQAPNIEQLDKQADTGEQNNNDDKDDMARSHMTSEPTGDEGCLPPSLPWQWN